MKIWVTICKVLGYIWLIIAGLMILTGIVGMWIKEGFTGVQNLMSPFNIVNYIVMIITVIPGIALLKFSDKLGKKEKSNE